MSFELRVCSYNIGRDSGEYCNLLRCRDPDFKDIEDPEFSQSKIEERSKEAERQAAQLLEGQTDVYCLQEVISEDRTLIDFLKKKGFTIIHLLGKEIFDTVIALDPLRFKNIQNFSFNLSSDENILEDVAVAQAVDIKSNQLVVFTSAHVPGFNFQSLNQREMKRGEISCEKIIQKLSSINQNAIQVIGADMNANPEVGGQRFEIFSKAGFQLNRCNLPTNVNPRDTVHQEREIDFIWTKMPQLPAIPVNQGPQSLENRSSEESSGIARILFTFLQKITAIVISVFQLIFSVFKRENIQTVEKVATSSAFLFNYATEREEFIGFDFTKNGSDHAPIILTLSGKPSFGFV
jgi:hypothetical protein